jgi:hypothetical protein
MARLVIPGNPRLRLSTGTKAEYCVLVLILCGFGFSLHLHSVGGLMQSFSSLIGQPEGVVALWQKESLRHRIIAHIEGRNVVSAAPVSADFEVIEVEGEKLLVRDAHGLLYLAGTAQSCPDCQIAIDLSKRNPARRSAPMCRNCASRIVIWPKCWRSSATRRHGDATTRPQAATWRMNRRVACTFTVNHSSGTRNC